MPEQTEQEKAAGSRPESPTTAKQLDFDDDAQDSTQSATPKSKPSAATVEDEAPSTTAAKPPRPTSPQQQAEHTLIEAFPSIDAKVIRAVLTASGGQVEPAFNALLGMSDPSFTAEETPPPQPPRPTAAQRQLEQDEMYARQLAQQYQYSAQRQSREQQGYDDRAQPPRGQDPRRRQDQLYADSHREGERERSFIDDDLPEIQESIRKGFIQTQNTVNSWFTNIKKRLDGEDNDDPYNGPTRQDLPPRPQQHSDYHGTQSVSRTRRSGDYDADPRELGDDFGQLELRDEVPPPKPARPPANPDLFKPVPAPPNSGPVDEVEAAERRAATTSPAGASGGAKKWQPLTSIAPQAEPEEHDPFSVGDSDDEKDTKTKDVKEADTARLKEAARKSISSGDGKSDTKELQESEKGSISTKNKEAEELLAKK